MDSHVCPWRYKTTQTFKGVIRDHNIWNVIENMYDENIRLHSDISDIEEEKVDILEQALYLLGEKEVELMLEEFFLPRNGSKNRAAYSYQGLYQCRDG